MGANSTPIYGAVGGNGSILFSGDFFRGSRPFGQYHAAHYERVGERFRDYVGRPGGDDGQRGVRQPGDDRHAGATNRSRGGDGAGGAASAIGAFQFTSYGQLRGPPHYQQLSDQQHPPEAWFQLGNTTAGGVARVDWSAPWGAIYQSHSFTSASGGTQCFSDSMNIAGALTVSMPGSWQVNLYWNGSLLSSAPFVISAVGVNQLIYQNQLTGQVNADYFAGTGGATLVGWACLSCGINTSSWRAAAIADFDHNGVPDLIYENTQTNQVNVDYYGGSAGVSLIGWACMSCTFNPSQWQVVGVGDFDGNGVPDLVFQNTQTHQVNVDYYGGPGGATWIGWACLSCTFNTSQWQVVGVGDFDGNGVPIWCSKTR